MVSTEELEMERDDMVTGSGMTLHRLLEIVIVNGNEVYTVLERAFGAMSSVPFNAAWIVLILLTSLSSFLCMTQSRSRDPPGIV